MSTKALEGFMKIAGGCTAERFPRRLIGERRIRVRSRRLPSGR
jgi:hypothetical protein